MNSQKNSRNPSLTGIAAIDRSDLKNSNLLNPSITRSEYAISPSHRAELESSCIASEIISRNFRTVEGAEVRKLLNAVGTGSEPLTEGGWFVSGCDPLNDFAPMPWGQFKADRPRLDESRAPIKYESPWKQPTRALFLGDPDLWRAAATDPSIRIVILEGAKKAGCVLSEGVMAVALPGVWQGNQPKTKELINEFRPFLASGRPIVIAFDMDAKVATRKAVVAARERLARGFIDKGCSVSIASWDEALGKGLDDVASNSGRSEVVKLIEAADPWVDEITLTARETSQEVRELVYGSAVKFSAENLLPSLGNALRLVAEANNCCEAAPVLTLLSCVGGLTRTDTYLRCPSSNRLKPFKTRCSLNVAIWGSSGRASKSEVISTFSGALGEIEREAEQAHKSAHKRWVAEMKALEKRKDADGEPPDEPHRRDVIITGGTLEGLIEALANDSGKGITQVRDELAGFIRGQNQYKGGVGSDAESFLEMSSNKLLKRRLVGGRYTFVETPLASVIGGIQPDKFRMLLGKDPQSQTDGTWARFVFCRMRDFRTDVEVSVDIDPLVKAVYRHLDSMAPMQFDLSPEALSIWRIWQVEQNEEINAQENNFLSQFVARQCEMGGRIALIAHLVEAAANGRVPEREISEQTMHGAMDLAKFCLNEAFEIFASYGITSGSPEARWGTDVVTKFGGKALQWHDCRFQKLFGRGSDGRSVKKVEILEKFQKLIELKCATWANHDRSAIRVLAKSEI